MRRKVMTRILIAAAAVVAIGTGVVEPANAASVDVKPASAQASAIYLFQYRLSNYSSGGKTLCLAALATSSALTMQYCNSADARQKWYATTYGGFSVLANYNWSTYPSTLWGAKTPDVNIGSKVGLSRPNGSVTHAWVYDSGNGAISNYGNPSRVFEVDSRSAGANVYIRQYTGTTQNTQTFDQLNAGSFTP